VELLGGCGYIYQAPPVPICQLSQLLAFQSKFGSKPTPSFLVQAWDPIAAPNPAHIGGEICATFQIPVVQGTMMLYTLDGRALETWPVQGSETCIPAPASPGIYFLGTEVKDQNGTIHSDLRKVAVLP
jgi:hypothetical protein